jgi:hypothetical protein
MTKSIKEKPKKIYTGFMLHSDLRVWLTDRAKKERRSLTGQIIYFLAQAREQEGGGNAQG